MENISLKLCDILQNCKRAFSQTLGNTGIPVLLQLCHQKLTRPMKFVTLKCNSLVPAVTL